MMYFYLLCAAVFGLVFGSFLNAVIYRVPKKETLNTRSHCPRCDAQITAWQNIPVLSYLILRGKCHVCREPISFRYPLIELLTGIAFVALTYLIYLEFFHLSTAALVLLLIGLNLFLTGTIALFVIDLETQTLPRSIIYISGGILIACLTTSALLMGEPQRLSVALLAAIGLFLLYAFIWFVTGGIGFGDVRLSFFMGFGLGWFGLPAVLVGVFLPFLLGGLIGVILLMASSRTKKSTMPFGPMMIIGLWVSILFGTYLVDIYTSLGGLLLA